jgi:hypothetical protein
MKTGRLFRRHKHNLTITCLFLCIAEYGQSGIMFRSEHFVQMMSVYGVRC